MVDLFGGEGLVALGYALAGWCVRSVEIDPERIATHARDQHVHVVEGDATTWPLDDADGAHGSPPCTGWTTQAGVADRARGRAVDTKWMLPHTLDRFRAWGGLWVVENVTGARRALPGAFKLCGTMFGLEDGGWHLARHRWFASSVPIQPDRACTCTGKKIIGVYGDLTPNDRRCAGRRQNRPNGDMRAGIERARRLMQAPPETSPRGLSLGLPVPYGRWLGEQMLTWRNETARVAG